MAGRSIVPNGSMWGNGLSVTRPSIFAVGSPFLYATQPCAASWKVIARMTGIAYTDSL